MNTKNLFAEIWDNPKLTDTEKVLMIGLLLKGEVLPADDVVAKLPDMLSDEHNAILISSLLNKYQTNQQPETPETSEITEVEPPSLETEDTVSEERQDQQPAMVEQPTEEQNAASTLQDAKEDVPETSVSDETRTDISSDSQPMAVVEEEKPKPRRGRPKGSKNKPKTTAAPVPLPAPAPEEKAPTEPLKDASELPIGDPPTDIPAMNVSEAPKRRMGRPKGSKNKPKTATAPVPLPTPASEEKAPAETLEDALERLIGNPPTDGSAMDVSATLQRPMGRPKGSKNKPKRIINGLENPTDEELIEKFKMGIPLEYDTLWSYCTGNKKYHYIRTNYQMEGANCIGIFVPYLPIFEAQKNCKEFILGIRKIEYSTSGTTQLRVMAQHEHKPYLKNEWAVLDRDQFASMQPLKEPLNRLLKKLGGDTLGNDKLSAVARPSFFSHTPTTRYTCDIKKV